MSSPAAVVLHLSPTIRATGWLMKQFYGPLDRALTAQGVTVRVTDHRRETVAEEIAADEDFHILDHGRMRHPRVLNCGPSHVLPWRYLDPWGIRAFSSVAEARFDPASVDPALAARVMADLRALTLVPRRSREEQPEERLEVPQGCIAVFLQSETHRDVGETCFMSVRQMVKALLALDDPRPVVIKPHPRETDMAIFDWLVRQMRKSPRLQVIPGNVHDILAAASVVVTINSAVAIEAMVHEKPVILCGAADFHHCALEVRRPADMAAALTAAEARDWPHAAFLGWFFGRQMIDPRAPGLARRVLQRIAAQGFDTARLTGGGGVS